ncbi:hypothetical protein RHRU231_800014 [Rhodococcus ruber]|uniref:Uncharacterized protein n=1 Tax=Rhodococcus ruber TaxID=1830 RepID=A0A098BS62_9NOCA|nr:hypothetical protein RHRU231_800014 [Rhodococcus ruber]
MVPFSVGTIAAFDEWTGGRGLCRPLPHPRTGAPTDFLSVAHGRRLGQTRLLGRTARRRRVLRVARDRWCTVGGDAASAAA